MEDIVWTPNTEEPEEGDYILSDSGPLGGRTTVSIKGEGFVGEYSSEDEAFEELGPSMQAAGFYPNIWRQDDHGGYVCITFER